MINSTITQLLDYAEQHNLIMAEDRDYTANRIIEILEISDYTPVAPTIKQPICDILKEITDYAVNSGLIGDTVTERDLFDTKIMGVFVQRPSDITRKFRTIYAASHEMATNWFYQLCCDSNYIRRDRISKDKKWSVDSEYGNLDITINLSKPEKDPREIAAARLVKSSSYPKCFLCKENIGYSGRLNAPARQNLRAIPIKIGGEDWFLQYSPYSYFNEHCIAFSSHHTPMAINKQAFKKLLDFVAQFNHYIIGSNADLPIVGGSILSHDHFQGGSYNFPMAKAPIETKIHFKKFKNIEAGIVKWPMTCLRLRGEDTSELVSLADKILIAWRGYSDKECFIFSETDGEPHNTITPIARYRDGKYELDLVLRNNITTKEHPLGVYHPHAELHHIKSENIGLIEVMGLAILPSRLKKEMAELSRAILQEEDISSNPLISKHATWANEIRMRNPIITEGNIDSIIEREIGLVFLRVLTDSGVYKRTDEGKAGLLRFIDYVNK